MTSPEWDAANEDDSDRVRSTFPRSQALAENTRLQAKLAKVEALADRWGAESSKTAVGIIKHGCATELRAVLADAPAEQREGGGVPCTSLGVPCNCTIDCDGRRIAAEGDGRG